MGSGSRHPRVGYCMQHSTTPPSLNPLHNRPRPRHPLVQALQLLLRPPRQPRRHDAPPEEPLPAATVLRSARDVERLVRHEGAAVDRVVGVVLDARAGILGGGRAVGLAARRDAGVERQRAADGREVAVRGAGAVARVDAGAGERRRGGGAAAAAAVGLGGGGGAGGFVVVGGAARGVAERAARAAARGAGAGAVVVAGGRARAGADGVGCQWC